MAKAKRNAKRAAPQAAKGSDNGKTYAIIAYITWIGWIVALILNSEKKFELAKFHLRQALLIMLALIACGIVMVIPILGWLVGIVGYIALLIFWIMGFIAAINGEKKEVPIIGKLAQQWFKGL